MYTTKIVNLQLYLFWIIISFYFKALVFVLEDVP